MSSHRSHEEVKAFEEALPACQAISVLVQAGVQRRAALVNLLVKSHVRVDVGRMETVRADVAAVI